MSTNLSSAELAALRGDAGITVPEVSPWDLGRVRRLSSDDVVAATRLIERALAGIEGRMREVAGLPIQVRLAACHEVDAEGLLDGIEDPLAMVCFQVEGQPGWCVWDTPMAVATVEAVLVGRPIQQIKEEEGEEGAEQVDDGAAATAPDEEAKRATDEETEPSAAPFDPEAFRRQPTAMERRVLVRLLGLPIDRVAQVLGINVESHSAVELRKRAPTWRETSGALPDPHRLAIDLVVTTEIGESTVSIYLPMPGGRALATGAEGSRAKAATSKVPDHLDPVPIEIDVVLGSAELNLAELMNLEVGDVIPIEAAVGDFVTLHANGIEFARGRIGTHRGHVAVNLIGEVAPLQKKP